MALMCGGEGKVKDYTGYQPEQLDKNIVITERASTDDMEDRIMSPPEMSMP